MHLKTHFKFLFNSSKISTSSAHILFFLNTRLHCDSTKIGITPFGSTKMEIQNSQNSIQIWTNALAFRSWVTDARDPQNRRARMSSAPKQGTDAALCCSAEASPAVRFSGDEEGTSVYASTSRADWPPKPRLYRPLGASAMATAARPWRPTELRRTPALNARPKCA